MEQILPQTDLAEGKRADTGSIRRVLVIDVGGTTSDLGMLQNGFPRVASQAIDIGGVRTNFRMPDVYSFGLGGGSIIKEEPLKVGPQSVGYELTAKSLIFGVLITLVGVVDGLSVRGGAEGVGRVTTAAVVHGIVAIIVTDMIFVFIVTR